MTDTAVANLLKELIIHLDKKLGTISIQIDKIHAQMDNFRAFEEKNHQKLKEELNDLKKQLKAQPISTAVKPSTPVTSRPATKVRPSAPMKAYRPPVSTTPSSVKVKAVQPPTTYAGMKETPIITATKDAIEDIRPQSYYDVQNQKKKVQKQTLISYIEKLSKAIDTTWPTVLEAFQSQDYPEFVDKGLTVLHGIIEFLFVAYKQEIPHQNMSYMDKAKSLSKVYKETQLLDKMEITYNQLVRKEQVVLARPLVRGWNERLIRVFDDFQNKKQEAYKRL